jgi:hypothetical protein
LETCEPASDNAPVSESRTSAIVASAAVLVGSLWAPWYAIDLTPAARGAIGSQTGQLPGVLGDFARQVLSLIPSHIEATGWQAFDKADVVLFACAIVAVMAALIDRMDVVAIAGVGAAGTVVLQMIDRPGPHELVSLKWGAWLALVAALAITGSSRMSSRRPVTALTPQPDWTKPTAPGKDPAETFAPF